MRQADDGLGGVFHLALCDAEPVAAVGFLHIDCAAFNRDDIDRAVILLNFIGIFDGKRTAQNFLAIDRHDDGCRGFAAGNLRKQIQSERQHECRRDDDDILLFH